MPHGGLPFVAICRWDVVLIGKVEVYGASCPAAALDFLIVSEGMNSLIIYRETICDVVVVLYFLSPIVGRM